MRVETVLLAPGLGAFFYDDQAAIRAGAPSNGFVYAGPPLTAGFKRIREPAYSLGIGLRLSDGATLWGDMMSVQYSGAGGRDLLFDSAVAAAFVETHLTPGLVGLDVADFQGNCAELLHAPSRPVPVAIQYGVSQALLRAAAHARRCTMAEVVCADYSLPRHMRPVPIFAQSGDLRDINIDKMILKSVDVLPHGLINAAAKFGPEGELFRALVAYVAARIRELGDPGYAPTLHFDLYGAIGLAFGLHIGRITEYLLSLADDAAPLALNIEAPADFGSQAGQIDGLAAIATSLSERGSTVRIVADEWCNTLTDIKRFAEAHAGHVIQIKTPDVGCLTHSIEAVLACHRHGIGAYLGGSCVETDLSAQACVHVAVATQADMMLAKPGMGVDEGLTIVSNEQGRLLAQIGAGVR